MGIELSTRTVEEKKIKRCNRIEITSIYNDVPSIRQDYEVITVIDDIIVKTDRDISDIKLISDLFDVTIEVNGKTITGADVAQFFFAYNDMPKE